MLSQVDIEMGDQLCLLTTNVVDNEINEYSYLMRVQRDYL